ncbi:hypothetical protein [Candidatus Igneacidithiobacillus taiwanensis]|uniref:hypothetical protein n=1 Tax=Candidatus Igneacidithiobacillus taiwanensis TaxID=1945924 RepID=UPI00289D7A96|nr:hypothetical protein [Candidatus Igneacidithiobacillus taiwanensis]MCE5359593.1 hypothetical protein [Acidithiobacillus sp.]
MLRIWIIEAVISLLLGAVVYRLSYSVLRHYCGAWVVVLLTAVLLGAGISGALDPALLHDLRANEAPPPTWLLPLTRALAYLFGAWIVERILHKRERLGFGPNASRGN